MGPLGDASAASPSSPGRTRTYNPSVNSRMLCRLSYRGRLRGRLYGPGVRASRFGGDGAQGFFQSLYLGVKCFFLVQVLGMSLAALAAQDTEAQPGHSHGGFGGVEALLAHLLCFGIEGDESIHEILGPLVGEDGVEVLSRMLPEQAEEAGLDLVWEVCGTEAEALGQRGDLHAALERPRGEVGVGEDQGQDFLAGLLQVALRCGTPGR